MRVLVTGGAGFIGSNFVRHVARVHPDWEIVVLDKLTYAGRRENLLEVERHPGFSFVQGDICDVEAVSRVLPGCDYVLNFAAETHVDRSIVGPEPFIQANVMGTFRLLEAARRYWLEEGGPGRDVRFHHVSTDEVYGSLGPGEPAWTEATPYAPNSPYAASKASSDHLVRAYGHTYGLPVSISNCSNNYGPYQFPEKLFPLMILNAQAGKPLPVYGDGQQIRDWLFVGDHCEAIHAILVKGRAGETYNIGGGNQPANLTIVKTICDMLDEFQPGAESHHALIQFVADRPGHDRRYAMDAGKIRRELGWQPRHSLEDGLRATVEWYLSHPEWIAAIQQRGGFQDWVQQNYENREKSS